jgi:hypothetical protein
VTFPSGLTGRFNQGFDVNSVLSMFDLVFTAHRAGSVRVFFEIFEAPGSLGFRVFGTALVMAVDSRVEVTGRSHVIAAVFFALQDVDVKWHGKSGTEVCHASIKKRD